MAGEWEHPERRSAPLLPDHRRRRGRARPARRASSPRGWSGSSRSIRAIRKEVFYGRWPRVLRAPRSCRAAIVEAEELWYDPHRWAAWIDGFGHVAKLEGDWPKAGARLLWDSPPKGRGRVEERVIAYEARTGQTVAVEDAQLRGTQTVAFAARPATRSAITLTLDYELKERNLLTPLLDLLFIRRALRESLRRTLARFGHERRAEIERHQILTGAAARSGRVPRHATTADHRRRGPAALVPAATAGAAEPRLEARAILPADATFAGAVPRRRQHRSRRPRRAPPSRSAASRRCSTPATDACGRCPTTASATRPTRARSSCASTRSARAGRPVGRQRPRQS